MAEVLYANFLADKRVYNLAQASWKRLFDRMAETNGFSYSPYINQIQGGRKEYDGNPIFSAFIASKNRAVRIIQLEPEAGGLDISAWVDTIELFKGKTPVQELVLDVVLSKQGKELARKLIDGWLTEGWTAKDVDRLLDHLI